jgi:SAM-dependent methyltransferase
MVGSKLVVSDRPDFAELDPYFLGYRPAERARLQRQAVEIATESRYLLDRIGVSEGARSVDIGCGPQGLLDLLAERVGPTGRVIGVERDEEAVSLARQFVAERRLANVTVVHGDGRATGLPRKAFDLAIARLVLVNVPYPEEIVAEMAALVRPGGVVAFHEADYVSHTCDPPLPAWNRLVDLLVGYSSANGIDLFIGKKVPRLLREAGLVDIEMDPVIHECPPGHARRTLLLEFAENLRDRLIAAKFVSTAEFDDVVRAVRRHLDDPNTLVLSHLFVRAWGRRGPEHHNHLGKANSWHTNSLVGALQNSWPADRWSSALTG